MRIHRAWLSSGFLAALSPAVVSAQQTPPTFSVGVETVYVDAFVNDRGVPVAGLTAANFELRDDGVRQRVSLVGRETMPLLAILVFDVSSSVEGEKMEALRAGARAFLAGLRPSDRVVLLSFNQEIARQTDAREPQRAREALDRLTANGSTSLYDALYAGLRIPKHSERAVLVLFSDGEDNSSWLDDTEVKRVAEESNVLLHVVGVVPSSAPGAIPPFMDALDSQQPAVTEPGQVRLLRQIAEVTGGRFWRAETPARLEQAFMAILDAMKTRYILSYEPQTPPRAGYHKLEIKLRGAKGSVHARSGYLVPQKRR